MQLIKTSTRRREDIMKSIPSYEKQFRRGSIAVQSIARDSISLEFPKTLKTVRVGTIQ